MCTIIRLLIDITLHHSFFIVNAEIIIYTITNKLSMLFKANIFVLNYLVFKSVLIFYWIITIIYSNEYLKKFINGELEYDCTSQLLS